jgi:UDP-galactopyranose mutase
VNYTDLKISYTRIIEHKHFENSVSNVSWITYETPVEYIPHKTEPYYPVNDSENNEKFKKYNDLMIKEGNIIFGGRLADYKYYDMHQVIETALKRVKDEILSRK